MITTEAIIVEEVKPDKECSCHNAPPMGGMGGMGGSY
jgi:hypothetical protein